MRVVPRPVAAAYYAVSLAALALIEWARNSAGDANLPPLEPATRFWINLLLLNLGAAFVLFVRSLDRPLSPRQWAVFALAGAWLAVATFPVFSGDLLEYLVRGRILGLYGENPYRAVPADFPNDLLYPLSIWNDKTDAYGPLFVWIETVPALVARHSINGMVAVEKLIFLGFMGWAAHSFARLARRVTADDGERARLVALFALNPLWIVAALVDGHNDVVMVAFTLCAVADILDRRYTRGFLFWSAAFLVKYTVLLLLPPLVLVALRARSREEQGRFPWGFALKQTVTNAAFISACFWPLWNGAGTFLTVLQVASGKFYTNTLPYAFHQALALAGVDVEPATLKLVLTLGYPLVYLWLLRECWLASGTDFRRLARNFCGVYLFFFVTVTSPLGAHYLLWALAWLALSRWPLGTGLVALYSFAGLFAYFKRLNYLILIACVLYSIALIVSRARGRVRPNEEGP